MKIINHTPHAIALNDGTTHAPSGDVARVSASFTKIVDGFCCQQFGEIENLPAQSDGVLYIVSGLVFGASSRSDLVAPATGHPATLRNDKGHIVSVPCLIRKEGK